MRESIEQQMLNVAAMEHRMHRQVLGECVTALELLKKMRPKLQLWMDEEPCGLALTHAKQLLRPAELKLKP